jgi:hypothetical protein
MTKIKGGVSSASRPSRPILLRDIKKNKLNTKLEIESKKSNL